MWIFKYAIKSIKENRLRTSLIALGTALGVMLATMLLLGNNSVEETVRQQVKNNYGDYNLQFGYMKNDQYLDDKEVDQIKNIKNLKTVSKILIPYVIPNKPEISNQPAYWGVEPNSPEIRAYKIDQGRYPEKGAEVTITKSYVEKNGIKLGEKIEMPFPPFNKKTVTVVGIINPPTMSAMKQTAFFPIEWLQNELNLKNKYNLVQIKTANANEKAFLVSEIKSVLNDVKIDQRLYVDKAFERLNVMQPLIWGLGGVALFVVALLVMGSFFLSVRDRLKQWALLRALGSGSVQIIGVVLFESLIIGSIGSLIGVALGTLFYRLVSGVINRWIGGATVDSETFIISWGLLILTFIVGIMMSIIGSIIPAMSIRKIPPVEAFRPVILSVNKKEKKISIISFFVAIVGIIIGTCATFLEKLIKINIGPIGAFLFVIGLLFAIPFIIRVITPIITKPFQRVFRIETSISSRNVIRNRQKAAISVAILSFGFMLALVGSMYMNSMQEGMRQGIKKSLPADLSIRVPMLGRENAQIPFEWLERIKQIKGVQNTAAIATDTKSKLVDYDFKKSDSEWYDFVRKNNINPERMEVSGIDSTVFNQIKKIKVVSGKSLEEPLKNGEGVISKRTADYLGIKLNDKIKVQSQGHEPQLIKIVSILEKNLQIGTMGVLVNEEWAKKNFQITGYESIEIIVDSHKNINEIQQKVNQVMKNGTNIELINSTDLLKEQLTLLNQMLLLIRLLVGIIFVISGIGLMNAIIASIYERRAEISMIRAVGAIPGQMKKIIWLEGTFLGLIASIIAAFGGIIFSYIVLPSLDLKIVDIPYLQILSLVVVSILLGTCAGLIAAYQVRKFKLHDTLKELSS
ncbi:ABC transporter permease [Bacillus pseudomycoides]|uniref:ABC transporter permease n=1 Tax=Bacillus pseudomycoides TaxID=64104 RepID=UPI000BEE6263|nr:FtsX-like permease family protein [Bacillus pseudomycoides]PEE04065.1 permease [Bacillus pseudomycoides]PEM78950.1 permease [Bacillus pseudomycoides]PHC79825.1 permease [Bacillus pseudomycoides]